MLNLECLLDKDSALYDDVSIRCCGNGVTMNSLFTRRCGNGVTMNSLFTRRCGNACSNELSVYPLLGSSHRAYNNKDNRITTSVTTITSNTQHTDTAGRHIKMGNALKQISIRKE
jgi:hypothetical protein